MMRKVTLTAIGLGIIVLIGSAAKPVVSADNSKSPILSKQQIAQGRTATKSFLGLWRGIDPLDGGIMTVSITDNDQDGKLKLRFSDNFIRVCQPEAGSAKTGRGIYEGTGTFVSSNILNAPSTVKCFDSNNAIVESLEVDWNLKLVGNTLEFTGTGLRDNTLIFHKVSN